LASGWQERGDGNGNGGTQVTCANSNREIYHLFAELFQYPNEKTREHAEKCQEILSRVSPRCAGLLREFAAFLENTPSSSVEEVYTSTFDLQPSCCPYIGWHLFGESYKRGAFLASLRAEYRKHNFSEKNELPDHIAIVLDFLASSESDVADELVSDCLVPAIEAMLQGFPRNENAYKSLLLALLSSLKEHKESPPANEGAEVFDSADNPIRRNGK